MQPIFKSALWALLSNRSLFFGVGLLLLIIAIAIIGPFLVDKSAAEVGAMIPRQPPSAENWFGTDGQGRDMFATLIHALPKTLKIGIVAGIISLTVGVALGLIAGFMGGVIDTVIRLASDVMMTIPGIAILVLIAANVRVMTVDIMAVVVAALSWMIATRTIRAQTLSLRERGYIMVARLNGTSGMKLIFVEVLPNLLPFIAASFVVTVSNAMLATIGLESLGLGPQNDLTLGTTIYWAQFYGAILRGMWWWWAPPIVAISLIFLGLLMTSSGMDALVNKRLA